MSFTDQLRTHATLGEIDRDLPAWREMLSRAADIIDAEQALADDLAADLAMYAPRSAALARYREARRRP